MTALFQKERWR